MHGARHDAYAFAASGLAEVLTDYPTVADLGYVGVEGIDTFPYKRFPGIDLSADQVEFNTSLSKIRAAVSAGGLVRVAARIRARIAPGICSRPAPRARSIRPAIPSASYRFSHRSTVGRDTPAKAAISFFCRPSASHITIRARVATGAGVSEPFVNARNSFQSSASNSTRSLNTKSATM